ncbi:MAG: PAS domain S-box protein [Chthoniobacteraceae bacterium]
MAKRFFPPYWLKRGGAANARPVAGWALNRSTTVMVAAALCTVISVGWLSYDMAAHHTALLVLPAGTLLTLLMLAVGAFRLNREAVSAKTAHERATLDLLESISDGFFALDREWRYTRINSAALRMLGKQREEVLGQVVWEVTPGMRDLAYERQFREAMREGLPVRFEEADLNPRGEWYEIRAFPTARGLNVFFNDITERKQTEDRLRQLSRAVDQSPAVVMITDTRGHIEYVNPKFTEITGYTLEEVRGLNPKLLRGPESIPGQGQELWETLRAGDEWRGEFHNRKKNGELYWEFASISPIIDDHGRATHYIAIKEDITLRKAMEQSLLAAKKEAEEANRTKDGFLAMLSHELRTPLAPVLLVASVSETDESLSPDVREQFQMIRNSVELEARLIDDLLDLTKVTRGKLSLALKPFNADEPLEKTLEMLRQDYAAKELKLDWVREAASTTVCADMARLHQVFWNLLKNAIKFTPTGGSITVRTFNPDEATLAVEVRDTGVGIAPEFLEEVFQPFRQGAATGKPQFGGLGLGLAITKAIVEMHGGTILAASPGQGQGSTFTVRIPLCTEPVAAAAGVAGPADKAPPLRILLVEDDKSTRTVLARLLRRDGHQVSTAGSCAEALNVLRAQPEAQPFESLLCDLGLPDGSGLDLVGPVKERSPGVEAIAISGFGMAEDVRRSREAGFDSHLVKPVNIEDLRSTLAHAA